MYDCGNVIFVKGEECIRKQLSLIASLGMLCWACSCFLHEKKKKPKSEMYFSVVTKVIE
jgi:hypothetical protein